MYVAQRLRKQIAKLETPKFRVVHTLLIGPKALPKNEQMIIGRPYDHIKTPFWGLSSSFLTSHKAILWSVFGLYIF